MQAPPRNTFSEGDDLSLASDSVKLPAAWDGLMKNDPDIDALSEYGSVLYRINFRDFIQSFFTTRSVERVHNLLISYKPTQHPTLTTTHSDASASLVRVINTYRRIINKTAGSTASEQLFLLHDAALLSKQWTTLLSQIKDYPIKYKIYFRRYFSTHDSLVRRKSMSEDLESIIAWEVHSQLRLTDAQECALYTYRRLGYAIRRLAKPLGNLGLILLFPPGAKTLLQQCPVAALPHIEHIMIALCAAHPALHEISHCLHVNVLAPFLRNENPTCRLWYHIENGIALPKRHIGMLHYFERGSLLLSCVYEKTKTDTFEDDEYNTPNLSAEDAALLEMGETDPNEGEDDGLEAASRELHAQESRPLDVGGSGLSICDKTVRSTVEDLECRVVRQDVLVTVVEVEDVYAETNDDCRIVQRDSSKVADEQGDFCGVEEEWKNVRRYILRLARSAGLIGDDGR